MRWVIGLCLVWLMIVGFINILSPIYDNIQNTVFWAFWIILAAACLAWMLVGGGI